MELKRAKVIMLPTNAIDYCCKEGEIVEYNSELFIADSNFRDPNNGCYNQQHLYITTDEEIKEGDWYVSYGVERKSKTGEIVPKQVIKADLIKTNEFLIDPWSKYCKKIIATTDKSLGKVTYDGIDERMIPIYTPHFLPQPSQAFVKKYCELGGIDEVDVEYAYKGERCSLCGFAKESNECINRANCPKTYFGGIESLKISSYNTITIHPIKDSWSREEVELLCEKAWRQGMYNQAAELSRTAKCTPFNNWIKENL